MNPNNIMMNMMMSNLQKQNPTAYNQIQQWMNSGQNPQQIIQNMLQSGEITQQQLNNAQNMAGQMKNQKRF